MAAHHLTLSEALKSGRLLDFIAQEQRGVPKADTKAMISNAQADPVQVHF